MSEDGGSPMLDLERFLPWLAGNGWRAAVRGGLERVLGLPQVRALLAELEERAARGEAPCEVFLELSGMQLEGDGVEAAIPRSGPLVVVANHPFGGADALALLTLCMRVRKDTRILANAEMSGIKALAEALIPLHILGDPGSERRNVAALRDGLRHLRGGGLLVVFPAGAVSHWQWKSGRVEDPPWPNHAARLIRKAEVPVLPVRFPGRNGAWFQALGAIHPLVRTALIPRAFLRVRGRTVGCEAGNCLEAGTLPGDIDAMTSELRRAVEQVSETGGN
jgi:putative hemolysin